VNEFSQIPRALWWEDHRLFLLDQTRLPSEEIILEIQSPAQLIAAIQRLAVRGAPALGIAGAYGVLLAAAGWQHSQASPDWDAFESEVQQLREARPTAVNLRWAIDRVIRIARESRPSSEEQAYQSLEKEAISIHEDDQQRCQKIGEYGMGLLGESATVITHCNAGALATGGIGTALGVIYSAAMHGKQVRVYADETRPLLQGARLTTWELQRAHIPVTIMTDGMSASLMHQQHIDCVIVGADRIANNGDTANKIGTYQLAIAAKAHQVPFYVAAPTSTVDQSLPGGDDIPIEMRQGDEVISWGKIKTAPAGVGVYSPAFDVTPASYISAIITDTGIAYPPFNFRKFLGED